MFPALQGNVSLTRTAAGSAAKPSRLLVLAASLGPLVACGGSPTSPDTVDFDAPAVAAPQAVVAAEHPASAAPEASCDVKAFEVQAVNFAGRTVLPEVVQVRIGNPQPACAPLRLTVWDATDPDDQVFIADSDGRFPADSELSIAIPCGIHVQIDLNNSPYTPNGARYSPDYFVKGWRGDGPACPAPAGPDPEPEQTPDPSSTPAPSPSPSPEPTPKPTPAPTPEPKPTPTPAPPACEDVNPPYSHYEAEGSVTKINGGRGVDVRATANLVNGRYRVKLMASSGSHQWVKDQETARVECRDGRQQVVLGYRNENVHGTSRFWVVIEPLGGAAPAREFELN
jgi:hypothetical protein